MKTFTLYCTTSNLRGYAVCVCVCLPYITALSRTGVNDKHKAKIAKKKKRTRVINPKL